MNKQSAKSNTVKAGKGHKPVKNRKVMVSLAVIAVMIMIGVMAVILLKKPADGNLAASAISQARLNDTGDLVIPVNGISDTATFYPVTVDGTKLEVLAVKAPDGTIRTAFNTCQVCYDSGRGYYKQEGDVLVCQNCGNRFPMSAVQVTKGGCNPVPIFDEEKTVDGTSITISGDYLQLATQIFQNWKSE